MARMKFGGTDKYIAKLERLRDKSTPTAKMALYQGAKVVADEIRKKTESIPVVMSRWASEENPLEGLTQEQKDGLLDSLGVSPMLSDMGEFSVRISFDGYNSQRTKKYPKGQPNVMIARSLESGTSFRLKHPFVRPALDESRKAARKAMQNVIDDEVDKIIK